MGGKLDAAREKIVLTFETSLKPHKEVKTIMLVMVTDYLSYFDILYNGLGQGVTIHTTSLSNRTFVNGVTMEG